MDNQENQAGSMPGDDVRAQNAGNNAGSTGLGNDATASGTARKSGGARGGAQSAATSQPTSQADEPSTAQATQGEDQNAQGAASQEGTLLDTALNSGKKWIEDSGVLNNVNQLPQSIKDLGNRAVARVNELSTTQKVVGGAILAVGLGWLATRGKGSKSSDSAPYNYGRQRDASSYGRRSYGYQAPDASTSRPSVSGATSRADSGSPYGNSGSRYGSSGSYGNTGIQSGSGRSENSTGASATTDHGTQFSSHSARSTSADSGFGSSSDE